MAVQENRTSGGNGFLYFAIGALIVAVGGAGAEIAPGSAVFGADDPAAHAGLNP